MSSHQLEQSQLDVPRPYRRYANEQPQLFLDKRRLTERSQSLVWLRTKPIKSPRP